MRGCRLRRVPGREHCPDPTRNVHVRCQGAQRASCGSVGRDHLQPGEHARSRAADHRNPGTRHRVDTRCTFEAFYAGRGIPFKGTDFSGRSDYGPFIVNGVPSGGLFTGAEGIKTAEEAAIWGGTAGQAYDPCYHLACDTFANNNDFALDVNADAIATATLSFGMSTTIVNGKKGKGNFKPDEMFPPA